MRFLFSLFLIVSTLVCSSQTILELIPDSLRKEMNEVVVSDLTELDVESLTSSSITRTYQVVILNKFAKGRDDLTLYYDDDRIIKNANVTVRDKFGEEKERFKLKDFGDFSTKGSSVAGDGRVKYLEFQNLTYPYLVEVSYTIDYNYLYSLPAWIPQSVEKQSVLSSKLAVTSKLDLPLRFREFQVSADSSFEMPNAYRYYWSVSSLKGYEYEKYAVSTEGSPRVYLAPTEFQMDGRLGNMSTWRDFGSWFYELNKGRNTLTADQLSDVAPYLKGTTSKRDTIRSVYKFLQENTRYVSIQLGIGGLQPFESGYVHERKYGDCKALSFYTQSILSSLNIESHYTLVSGGYYPEELLTTFPNDYFNHVILTVPMEADTVWLECTSQTNSFGSLGTFTGNRYALMIRADGGHLIKTKHYSVEENVQTTKVNVFLEASGAAQAAVERTYSGQEIENNGFRGTYLLPESKQTEWFIDNHDWSNLKVVTLELEPPSQEPVPKGKLMVELEFDKLAKPSGKRLFYEPFAFSNIAQIKLPNRERENSVHLRYPYSQRDSIEIVLPAHHTAERMINSQHIDSKFGNYSVEVKTEENKIILIRTLEMKSGIFLSEDYVEFRDFVRSVQKGDRQKLILLNKT